MKLFFLRHTDAVPGHPDEARELSEKGFKQGKTLGRFLARAEIDFDSVYSSPLIRARQTAETVLAELPETPTEIRETEALCNETGEADFFDWLDSLGEAGSLLLVGHAPTLGERVCTLMGIPDPAQFTLPKGGLVCLQREMNGDAELKFFVSPKIL